MALRNPISSTLSTVKYPLCEVTIPRPSMVLSTNASISTSIVVFCTLTTRACISTTCSGLMVSLKSMRFIEITIICVFPVNRLAVTWATPSIQRKTSPPKIMFKWLLCRGSICFLTTTSVSRTVRYSLLDNPFSEAANVEALGITPSRAAAFWASIQRTLNSFRRLADSISFFSLSFSTLREGTFLFGRSVLGFIATYVT
mmetsp:Transcript_39842/g.158447  ORF Transcript_39842/g.158447 Transcript_39842/m.158447 type:complete len:200 (-) Transcript_39842:3860-4459(-)